MWLLIFQETFRACPARFYLLSNKTSRQNYFSFIPETTYN